MNDGALYDDLYIYAQMKHTIVKKIKIPHHKGAQQCAQANTSCHKTFATPIIASPNILTSSSTNHLIPFSSLVKAPKGLAWASTHQCTSWPFCPWDGLHFFI